MRQVRVKKGPLGGHVGVFAQQLSFQACVVVHVNTILILSAGVITGEATDLW